MSHLETNGCKKRKRGERVFKFKTFGDKGCPVEVVRGSFRENVKALLEYGTLESSSVGGGGGTAIWSFQLEVNRHSALHVLLFVVEESVEMSHDRHCKDCLYVGWGDHMICNKKYHFLVPSKDTLAACLSYETNDDFLYGNDNIKADFAMGKLNFKELNGHTMHGVLHSNGFGHLLCINGMETGSDLAGRHVMEFWDRLCTGLQARVVSLKDVAQKRSMDLRLLHGIAYSEPWFGRWGYKFGRGSFGATLQTYQTAIETIQAIPLCLLAHHLATSTSNLDISIIFSRYQTLSSNSLTTIGDLFRFMLELKTRLPRETVIDSYNPGILVENNCRWSPKRVEMAARVIVEALKKAEFRWVSRQEVRDAARAYVGDTGLLDFVLKSLGNHIVGHYLVRRCLNPVTKVLEYCLEDISGVFPNQDGLISKDSKYNKSQYKITRLQLAKDTFYVYKNIFKGQNHAVLNIGLFSTISLASRVILDTKYFVKEYIQEIPAIEVISSSLGENPNLYCTIMVTKNQRFEEEAKTIIAPYECISMKSNATFEELSLEVEKTFKEIYWGLKSFKLESIVSLCTKGSDYVFRVVKVGSNLVFEGRMVDERETNIMDETIYERGRRNRVVDCHCGAKDDDGERMVACDICEVWQHTRCVGVPNNEQVPNIFLCTRCEQDILVVPVLP